MSKHLQKNNPHQSRAVTVQEAHLFSGPLPHPDILAKYNEISPGAAERIIKMAENQSSHRIELEGKVITSDINNSKRGQLYGFIISIVGILSSVVLLILGYNLGGSVLGGTTFLVLASVFVYGAKTRSDERIKKEQPARVVNQTLPTNGSVHHVKLEE